MEEHKEPLAGAVALITSGPETGPLTQDVCASRRATPGSLVDAEIDLDDAGGSVGTLDVANGCDLADEDYSGLIGHLVERVFDCLGRLTRRSLCRGQRCD
jgi:hypothetical protein